MYQELVSDFFDSFQMMSCKEGQKVINAMMKGERFVLMYLLQNGPSFPGKIAEKMGSSTANIAKILRTLEQRGFVCRTCDQEDKRKKRVSLSEEGRKLILNEKEQAMKYVTMVFKKLGEHDAREFVRLIQRIADVNREIEDKDE